MGKMERNTVNKERHRVWLIETRTNEPTLDGERRWKGPLWQLMSFIYDDR